jgi:hypothetical protein
MTLNLLNVDHILQKSGRALRSKHNVSKYWALIRGLKVFLDKGIDCIHVSDNFNHVCM